MGGLGLIRRLRDAGAARGHGPFPPPGPGACCLLGPRGFQEGEGMAWIPA